MRITILMMCLSIFVNSAAHIFLKCNNSQISSLSKMNLSPISFFHLSPFFAIALLCFGTSVIAYNKVLERLNLNFAFPVMNTCVYLCVGILSWIIFKERYTTTQTLGLVISIIGLTLFSWR